jgi:23S rRNA (pseudouridine1915-N3)-methyltransferase
MIYCVFVGPFKEKSLRQTAEEYRLRLERLWPVTVLQVPEKPKEILKFVEAKKARGALVSLQAQGEKMDSAAFTRWVTQSSRDIYFLAWGADGPPREVQKTPMREISLSPMTYPHELARVLLMEQLYRAGAALKGHPYPR